MDPCNQESIYIKSEQLPCQSNPCDQDLCNKRYIQPCIPKPCRPISSSFKNEGPISTNTVYKCSYNNTAMSPKRKPIKQNDHLVMAGDFDYTTINKLSYPIHCSTKVEKIVPRSHCLVGKGPMKKETTNIHDYFMPCSDYRRKKIVPRPNLMAHDCPMNFMTTNKCSYRPVCGTPVTSYKPTRCYAVPEEKMDMNTVQRCSYKFKCPSEKLKTPWAARMAFCKPKERVENCTVYNQSFLEPGYYVPVDGQDCNGQQTCVKVPRTCCPVGCLAANVEARLKSTEKKAHHYN